MKAVSARKRPLFFGEMRARFGLAGGIPKHYPKEPGAAPPDSPLLMRGSIRFPMRGGICRKIGFRVNLVSISRIAPEADMQPLVYRLISLQIPVF
jgi:hypothetical protein